MKQVPKVFFHVCSYRLDPHDQTVKGQGQTDMFNLYFHVVIKQKIKKVLTYSPHTLFRDGGERNTSMYLGSKVKAVLTS